jgi:hypothetical protein
MKLFLALLVCLIGYALASAPSNFSVSQPVGPSPDVTTAFVFPDHPAKGNLSLSSVEYFIQFYSFIVLLVITAGDVVEVLLGFVNNGDREFNITSLSASLNHPLDFRYYIQNVCIYFIFIYSFFLTVS